MITTRETLPDLVPVQVTIDVDGAVELANAYSGDAPGGFTLQVPDSSTSVWYGASTVDATASSAARGLEIAAGESLRLDVRSLRRHYVTGTSTRLTVVALVARS